MKMRRHKTDLHESGVQRNRTQTDGHTDRGKDTLRQVTKRLKHLETEIKNLDKA